MPKHARFRPTQCAEGWRINIPASISATGKRERYFYRSRDEARAKAAELRQQYEETGAQAEPVSPSLADSARRCSDKLAHYGYTLESGTNAFLRILDAQGASVPLSEAAELWLAAKTAAECREATLKSYRYTVKRLEPLAGERMCDLSAADVEAAIAAKPTSFEMHRRNARALFLFSAKRGWCEEGVLRGIDPRKGRAKEIQTLTPAQVRKLLKAAEKYYPETVAAFSISLFAGLRSKEVERLTWRDIHDDGIEVAASTSKRDRRRFVSMNPTLAAWLKGRRLGDEFLVIPGAWREKSSAVRRLAGFDVAARILKRHKPEGVQTWPPKLPKNAPAWPQNGMRHTHASASMSFGKGVADLTFEFGHTGDLEMLRNHYVGAYRPRDAVKFWSIGPEGKTIEVIRAA